MIRLLLKALQTLQLPDKGNLPHADLAPVEQKSTSWSPLHCNTITRSADRRSHFHNASHFLPTYPPVNRRGTPKRLLDADVPFSREK